MKKLTLLFVLAFAIQATVYSQSCLPDSIIFTTQTQIDSFQINYPNCTTIEGNVRIIGRDLTNLNGLNVLTIIGGDFQLSCDSTALTNLTGLDALTSIGGDFYFSIRNNTPLTNLTGLDALTSIGGDFHFSCNNYTLTNLTGLDALISIGGDFHIGFWVTTPITSLTGLEALTSIGGEFIISGAGQFTSLTGLSSLTSIGGDFRLSYQYSLTNYTGLEALTSIGGSIIIGSSHLDNLTGLSSLTSLGGGLYLSGNVYLASLSGLETLTSIGGGISIIGHNNITNLFGLENITSIGGGLRIGWNNGLTSLTGIENINPATIDSLFIADNSNLSTCEVQSICDYLVSPVGSIEIHDNAPGCNSQAEVEEACEANGIAEIVPNIEFSIYPNPAKDDLFIKTKEDLAMTELNIYNYLGQRILHKTGITTNINVSMLPQGVYILELASNKSKLREKLIIK